MTATLRGSRLSLYGLLSWHSLPLRGLSTLGTGRRSLFCTRHPFMKMNRAVWTFNFLVAPLPSSNAPFFKLETNGVVQLFSEPTSYTSMGSINGEHWVKKSTLLGMTMCSVDTALARQLAYSFSPLGIWKILACRSSTFLFTCSRYFFILSPLQS